MNFNYEEAERQIRKLQSMQLEPTVIFISPRTHWELCRDADELVANRIYQTGKMFNLTVKLSKDIEDGEFYLSF